MHIFLGLRQSENDVFGSDITVERNVLQNRIASEGFAFPLWPQPPNPTLSNFHHFLKETEVHFMTNSSDVNNYNGLEVLC